MVMTLGQTLALLSNLASISLRAARAIEGVSEIVTTMREENRTELTDSEWAALREARELAREEALRKIGEVDHGQ